MPLDSTESGSAASGGGRQTTVQNPPNPGRGSLGPAQPLPSRSEPDSKVNRRAERTEHCRRVIAQAGATPAENARQKSEVPTSRVLRSQQAPLTHKRWATRLGDASRPSAAHRQPSNEEQLCFPLVELRTAGGRALNLTMHAWGCHALQVPSQTSESEAGDSG